MTTLRTMGRKTGRWLPVLGVTAVVGTATGLAMPAVLGRTLDAVVAGRGAPGWVAVVAVLIAAGLACDLVNAYAEPAGTARATGWLRNRLVGHLLSAGPPALRRFDTGDLVSRVSANAAEAGQAGTAVLNAAFAALPPLGALAMLVYIDPWIALAFLAGVTLVALIVRAFARRTAAVTLSYQQAQGGIAARLAESLAGARTIAAAGTVDQEERRVLTGLTDLRAHGIRTWRVLSRTSAQAAVVGPLVLLAVLATGGFAVMAGRITPGDLFAASRYAMMGAGIGGLTGVFGRLARSRAGLDRAAEVLDVAPVAYGGRAVPDGPGRLEFRRVTVAGDGAAGPLLDTVDLVFPAGAVTAVVGRSGAGKSVLAEVAARLRDPDSGAVLLDGVPLPELDHATLRAAVGCAFERPRLVGGTVADAVGLGLDLDRVREAARATHAHEFVSRLPGGYDTPLADAPMSGGEAQRLGLARAWHAGRVLVLDDATSSLDTVTELQISRTLTDDASARTRLVVTHRAATATRADLVVWLDGGRVRAVGRHDDLWADPAYREVFL